MPNRQVIAGTLAALLAGCTALAIPEMAPTSGDEGAEGFADGEAGRETTILVNELGDYSTYVDKQASFAFDYPAGWGIVVVPEIPDSTVTISSWQPESGGGGGIPDGGQKIDITPLPGVEFQQALTAVRLQYVDQKALESEVLIRPGVKGVLFVFPVQEGEVEDRVMLASVDGFCILFSGLGDPLTYFEAIAYSVRQAP